MLSHHFQKLGKKSFLFSDIALSISDRVDDPRLSGVDRYVGLEHLDSQSIKIRRWGKPDDVSATKLRFYPGDVIYGRRRAYQRKLGVADFEGICSAHALVLRAKEDVCLAKFLPYFLQTDLFHQKALDISVGSLSPTINWKTLARQKFFLPSLKDQEKIIEIISSIDKTIEAYQDLPLESQRESMLHELLSAGGDDWTETTLGAHIKIVMGQAPPGKDCNEDGVGVPFVKAGEFTDGFPLVREWTTNPLKYSKLGDTLICVVGATCGKLSKGIDCAIGRSVAALQPLETLDGGFLWNFMARKVQEMRDGSRGSAQGVITKDDLADLQLGLPPLVEQKRIVEIVSSMDEVIRATKQAIRDLKALRISLLTEILSVNDNG
jgi:type I restriction enzyme S subunit